MREEMALLLQLPLQGRQRLLDLRQRRLLRHHVGFRDLAKAALAAHQVEQVGAI